MWGAILGRAWAVPWVPAILVVVGPGNPPGLAQEVKELPSLRGHTDAVWSVAFSPEGKALASGSADGTVKLWDLATGKNVVTLGGPKGVEVLSVAFQPDGKVLAAGGEDAVVRLWDAASGKSRAALAGHTAEIQSLAYSPDGKLLASASQDQTVKLWDPATGKVARTLEGHRARVDAVAFSPDGKSLASAGGGGEVGAGGQGGTVRVWDIATGRNVITLKAKDSMQCVAFSPDGKTLAAGGWVSRLRQWSLAGGGEPRLFEGHLAQVWSVAFHPRGKLIASACDDRTVRLWDVTTQKEVGSPQGPPDLTAKGGAAVRSVAFSPDGRVLAGGDDGGTVRLWQIPDERK